MRVAGAGLPAAALAVLLLARPAAACPGPAEGYTRLVTPEAEIAYRWEPGALKVGQFFKMEVVACRAPGPVESVIVDAQMPAHGHGMNYRPQVTQAETGAFLVSGLMLHMPGRWQLTIDLVQGDRRTRLQQSLDLRP